jgi:quinol monooxygenase YgiN
MHAFGKIDVNIGDPATTDASVPPINSGPRLRRFCSLRGSKMVKCGLLVRLEARPGKEQALADFLAEGLDLTNSEATTPIWFALKLSPTTFGVFDAFASEADRQAHLGGNMAKALMSRAEELLASPPSVEPVDILGMKNQLA